MHDLFTYMRSGVRRVIDRVLTDRRIRALAQYVPKLEVIGLKMETDGTISGSRARFGTRRGAFFDVCLDVNRILAIHAEFPGEIGRGSGTAWRRGRFTTA